MNGIRIENVSWNNAHSFEEVLDSTESPGLLDARLRLRGASLRCVAREIPPVFGSFF